MSAPTLLPGRPTGEDVCLAVWLHWRCWTEVLSTARSGDGGCPVLALAGRSFVNQTASTKDTHTHAHALHGSLTGVRGKVKLEGTRHLHRPATFMLTRPGPPGRRGTACRKMGVSGSSRRRQHGAVRDSANNPMGRTGTYFSEQPSFGVKDTNPLPRTCWK